MSRFSLFYFLNSFIMGKRKGRNSNFTIVGEKDRISELPDDVLGIIISHLKTEEAVRTSVLSSRWKSLWKSTTCFNFDADQKVLSIHRYGIEERKELIDRQGRKFIQWVEQVVDNHEGSYLDELVVDYFYLDKRHSQYLDKWISFAVSKRVKAIKIELFPNRYDDNKRIENYAFIDSAPSLSGIECLTSLCLEYVDVNGELIEQLLYVCPLLERLSLANSENLKNLKVSGSSLKLKYFEIKLLNDLNRVEICAPNLVSFRWEGSWILEERVLQVENLSSLVDLYITYSSNYVFFQFSSCFSQLETLTLKCPLNKTLLKLLERSQFTSLKHLTFIDNCFKQDYIRCLPEFISLCPVLHKFTLDLHSSAKAMPREIKWGKRRLDSLKVVEIIDFFGHDHEIQIARFFLRNAISLNIFIIKPYWTKDKAVSRIAEGLKSEGAQGVKLLIY